MRWILALPLLTAACGAKDTDTIDTAETADTVETADTADTGADLLTGSTGRQGDAAVDLTTYAGTEDWYFVADEAQGGGDICRIRTTLTATTTRSDCDICKWAYDLVVSDAQIVGESGPGCAGTAGVDELSIGTLNGSIRSYGYTPDYYGHVKMLMIVVDGEWIAAANAEWDDTTGVFLYDWNDGYFHYPGD